jgi:hypothetical protein
MRRVIVHFALIRRDAGGDYTARDLHARPALDSIDERCFNIPPMHGPKNESRPVCSDRSFLLLPNKSPLPTDAFFLHVSYIYAYEKNK